MFDGNVFIDKIPNNDSDQPAIHIYTRPFDLSTVKLRDSLSIYTTATLKSVMIYDKNSKVRESIKILNAGDVSYAITLPNGKTLWIYTYSCNSKTLNVIVLFEYCDRYTLYAGRFIASDSKLFEDVKTNKNLRALMQEKKIDGLHIDATTAHINEANLKFSACKDIDDLIKSKKYQDYKFHLLINDFGYESLLLRLAKMNIKMYLDLDNERIKALKTRDILQHFCKERDAAKIILVDQLDISNVEKQFVDEKIISIELTPDDKVSDSDGLRFIKFSVHPTMADISFIATITAPFHIYTIGHSIDFPFKLNYLCRSADPMTIMKEKNNRAKQQDDQNKTIV